MSYQISRRNMIRKSLIISSGATLISINGILVPRESEAISPIIGFIFTSIVDALLSFLSYRNRNKALRFQEQFNPYDVTLPYSMRLGNLHGQVKQTYLFSEEEPINGFKDTIDGGTLLVNQGNTYLTNGSQMGKLDPAELKVADNYHRVTGKHLYPNEHIKSGYYNSMNEYQRDLIKEQERDHPYLKNLGTMGEDYFIQGTREFRDDGGTKNLMAKITTTDSPKHLKTVAFYAA